MWEGCPIWHDAEYYGGGDMEGSARPESGSLRILRAALVNDDVTMLRCAYVTKSPDTYAYSIVPGRMPCRERREK
jgi:hypothetical protein